MDDQQLIKWGLGLWLGYEILREINSNSQPITNNVNPVNYIPGNLAEYNTTYHGNNLLQLSQNSPTSPDISRSLEESLRAAYDTVFKKPTLLEPQTRPSPDPQTIETGKWLNVIPHPSNVIILGKRGSGKSALGYKLLEYLRYTATPYVVGLPSEARKLLPDWIGMAASLEDVPPKAVVLVDEANIPYHARSSMAAESKAMSQLVNLSRQREQTLVFVSQEARQLDKNIDSSANVVILKDLGILQVEFDRREFNKIATEARQAFSTITGDKRKWGYIYSPDSNFMGLMESSLPTFWSEKLSHIFAIEGQRIARAPGKASLSQRIEKTKELKRQGLSLGQIAKLLGVTKPTVKNYLEDYPYRRK